MKFDKSFYPILKRIALYIILIYGGLCLYIYSVQESLIFFPVKADYSRQLNKHSEEIIYKVNGLKLHGWLINKHLANKKLIVYYGGNAEDVYYNINHFSNLTAAALLINYRGYGYSEGTPGEEALFSDALKILQIAKTNYKPKKTIIFGRSVGTGIASFVASKVECSGVILITPFDSMSNLAGEHYPLYPTSLLLRHKFDSTRYAPKITSPVLVVYGSKDRIIPNERTENLLNFFKVKYKKVRIDGADHNDIAGYSKYWHEVSKFVDNL
ncbi:MAG: hypothetical protein OEV42_11765 [Deltaproteobacteria bacterium]|nr:hypothetical protein [Deltaproteobacteria bacterium]